MPIYSKHLRIILKGLKYQALDNLIGREIEICSIDSVESDILSALDKELPAESSLIVSKDPLFKDALKRVMEKYGFIDAEFSVSNQHLKNLPRISRSILEDLDFVDDKDEQRLRNERSFSATEKLVEGTFEELVEDIEENKAYIKLFIEMKNRNEFSQNVSKKIRHFRQKGLRPKYELLKDFFPHTLVVTDACLTNSDFVWINKHFYL